MRIMAIDYGDAHTGIAISDATGTLAGFTFSKAMSGSGITWSEAELQAFLANPSAKVPGTAMPAGQVADPQRRAAIAAYLASLKS